MESGFRNVALDALFPRFCLSCKREGSLFCESCDAGWVARPNVAACPFCFSQGSNAVCISCRERTSLDGVVSYLPYGNAIVRSAIACWKYDGDRSIEPVLKRWLMQSITRMSPTFAEASEGRPPFDLFVVTHIPVHATRKRTRGFDQAEHLATWVAEMYAQPREALLVRHQKTASQAKTIHTNRHIGDLDGIFSIHPSIKELPESVLLCDDVFTSGATMGAAARCLKEAGVKQVWGFVIAQGNV